MVGSRVWRRRLPDLQAIMLRSCEELKMENLGTGMGDVERRMINCSIPLILIGHHANNGALWMEIPTYLNFIGRFSGAISQQTMERKQASKNSKQTHFKVLYQSYLETLSDS